MKKFENNIIFSNKEECLEKLKVIKKNGIEKFHFLADFDCTMTKSFVNWKKIASMVDVLRWEEKALWEECFIENKKLFSYYYPIEHDKNILLKEKKEKMIEWWTKSFNLFIKYWLSLECLINFSKTEKIQLRDFLPDILKITNKNNIPFVILSASAFWKKSINYYLKHRWLLFDNIDIISNDFIWDDNWYAIDYKRPIIHSFNKNETSLLKFPKVFNKIKNRKNIILLWDSLWDHHMADWFDYENILKIWFLNQKEEENLEEYKKRYDIIITWDWDFNYLFNYLNDFLT